MNDSKQTAILQTKAWGEKGIAHYPNIAQIAEHIILKKCKSSPATKTMALSLSFPAYQGEKMSCCSPNTHSDTTPDKLTCPANGKAYRTVPNQTLLHHLKAPWMLEALETPFAFCDDPACKVIYFNATGQTFTQDQVRTPVGQKSNAGNALICYCFGVDKTTAQNQPEAKAFVIQQTKNHQCACEIRNPSSRCCLKDFPKCQGKAN